MTQVKAIQTKITDEYGQPFPSALAYIIEWHVETSEIGTSKDIGDEYVVELSPSGMAYKVMYWYSTQTKAQGFKARELRVDDNEGGFTSAISVDLDHAEYKNIMNSQLNPRERVMNAMEADLKRRFR